MQLPTFTGDVVHCQTLMLLTVRAVSSYDKKRLQVLWRKNASSVYLYLHKCLLTLAAGLGNISRKALTLVETKNLCSTQPRGYLEVLSWLHLDWNSSPVLKLHAEQVELFKWHVHTWLLWKLGFWRHSPFRKKVAYGMFTTPTTANIKYLVKITRDENINANQLRMLHVMERWGLEKQLSKVIQHPTYLFPSDTDS